VFVTDLDRYQSYANAHSGVITDQLWDEAISIPIQAVPTTSEAYGTDIETRGQEEIEENTRLDDNESEESDPDEDEEDDVLTEAEQRVATAGERLARQHIENDALSGIITSHRRWLGFLLLVTSTRDRRKHRLNRRLLKEKKSIAAIINYMKFLRIERALLDCRRFQLFPEYKMVIKYFKLDEVILKHLCRPQAATVFGVDTKGNIPSEQKGIWEEVFHFDKIGIRYAV
jgi:hypothetical protein